MKKLSFLSIPALIFTLLFCTTAFAQKNVAVLEIERHPDVVGEISRAEAMEITGIIRSEAVRVLPSALYSVMTSETVMSMSGAVLADCAEENCIITIGRRIDADYVVRGSLRKFQTMFTLSVEMFETDFGNLVATATPARSEDLVGLLDKSAEICESMYKSFLERTTYTLTTKSDPPAAGSVKRDPDLMNYAAGTRVSMTATPAASELDRYKKSDNPQEIQNARNIFDNNITTRNLLYILGGIGAAGFAVTLFFIHNFFQGVFMFKQKAVLVAAVSAVALGGAVGCAREFISTSAPSVSISPNSKSATTLADLDVAPEKVIGQAAGRVRDRDRLRAGAISQALILGDGADVLVGAQFHEKRVRDELTITVVGYPARYRNFRPAPEIARNRNEMFTIETVDGVTIIGFNRTTTVMEQDDRGNIMFTNIEGAEVAQAPATPAAPLPVVPQYVPAPPAPEPAVTQPAQEPAPVTTEPAESAEESEKGEL